MLILRLFVSTLAVLVSAYILPGVHVDGILTAVVVAVVLGVLNTFLKPLLIILTLPVTVFTLGLFLFAINGAIVLLAAKLVKGFTVDNLGWAVCLSLIVSFVSGFLHSIQ